MGLKIRTVATIVAGEDVAEVPLVAHPLDVEVTMVTMVTVTAMANQKETTNSKTVRSLHAGGATFTDIVKRIVANASRQTPRAKVSMDQPIGLKTRLRQSEKMKMIKKFSEQSEVKCILANSQVSSRVFNEGRSYFPDLRPKNIFFNDYDVVFNAFAENKFIFKENFVHQWGNLQNDLQPKFNLPVPIFAQHHDYNITSMDKCYKTDSLAIWKNLKHHHRWKTALCQGQSEWLRKKLSL